MLKTEESETGIGDDFLDIILNSMDQDGDGKISFDEFVDFIYNTKKGGGSPSSGPQIKVVDSPSTSARDTRATSSLRVAKVSFGGEAFQRPHTESGTRSLPHGQAVSIRDEALARAAARRGIPPRRPSLSPSPRPQ